MIHWISGTLPQTNPFERLQWMLVFGNWKSRVIKNFDIHSNLGFQCLYNKNNIGPKETHELLLGRGGSYPSTSGKHTLWCSSIAAWASGKSRFPFEMSICHHLSGVSQLAMFDLQRLYSQYDYIIPYISPWYPPPKKNPINLKGNTTNLTRLSKGWLWASSPLPCPGQATTCNIHTYYLDQLGGVLWCFMSGGCHYKPIFPSEFRYKYM